VLRRALMAAAASERVRKAVTGTHAARAVVDQYVAGESSEDAVAVARALRAAGLLVTLDYLGEDTTDAQVPLPGQAAGRTAGEPRAFPAFARV